MLDVFSKTLINDMEYGLNVLSEKNKQITRNIANKDTPMYKAKKLVFDEVMSEYFSQSNPTKLYATNAKHLQISQSSASPANFVRNQNNPSTRTDGNDVNMDYEMTEQAGMSIMYSMLTEITGSKFASIKEAMRTR